MCFKYFRIILFSIILIRALGSPQIIFAQAEIFPDHTLLGFDLTTTRSESQDDAVILRWYPRDLNFAGFKIRYTRIGSDVTNEIDVGLVNEYLLKGLEKDAEYEFTIIGYDDNLKELITSVTEKILLKPAMTGRLSRVAAYTAAQPSVKLTLTALDANTFPFIFSTIQLDTSNLEGAVFTKDHFKAFENGAEQKDYFRVTFPDSFEGVRLLDFVFLIDNSGSMEPEHRDVWQNVGDFVDSLKARKINFQLGLVRFGQAQNWGNPILVNDGNLTDNVDTFKDWIQKMTTDGGYEPGIEAVYRAATKFNFRRGAYKHFLLITDEDSDAGDLQKAIIACNTNSITVHCAVDLSYGYSYTHYGDPFTSIRSTGGLLFPVLGPYNKILDELQRIIGNTYIVRYRTDHPVYDAQLREVIIRFSYLEHTSQDTGYYTPGAPPKIVRTPETMALSDSSILGGTEITIAARITDAAAPFVHAASLFYKHLSDPGFYSTPMIMIDPSDSIYAAAIPESIVRFPGIEYYITAADSHITSKDPLPPDSSYQIAVHPNEPPLILHTPIEYSPPAVTIVVSCEAIDNTNRLVSVKLHFRKTGTLSFTNVIMENTRLSTFTGLIPRSFVTYEGVDYYLSATDDLGVTSTHGSSIKPHYIAVGSEGDHIVSDSTWKCFRQYIAGWETIDFDDSSWPHVYVLDESDFAAGYPNQPTDYLRGITQAGINEYRFIWDSNGLATDEVWFRKSFNLDPSNKIGGAMLNFGVNDDYVELYLNGTLLGQNTDQRPSQFEQYDVQPYLKGGRNVLAIHARYSGVFGDPHHNDEIDPNKWFLADLVINPQGPPITLEAEDMNFGTAVGYDYDSGIAIPGGKYIAEWIYFPRVQNYRFIIQAKTLNRRTTMKLRLRHVFEETAEVTSTTYQTYEFMSLISSAKHRVDIENLESSGLVVDWIRIEPVDTIQPRIIHIFEAEGMPVKHGGRAWGFFWVLSHTGDYVGTDFTLPIGMYQVMVIVRREDRPVKMLIHLDDTSIDANTNELYYSFIFENNSSELHTMKIESLGGSLYVDKVIIQAVSPALAKKNIEAVEQQTPFPNKFAIAQNYPNPFNPDTKIKYQLPRISLVTLKIYNCLGQEIRTLINKVEEPGKYEIHWDGKDDFGKNVPSGLYIYTLRAGQYKNSKKMIKLQ